MRAKWAIMLMAGILAGGESAAQRIASFDDDGAITIDGERTLIIGTYYCGHAGLGRPLALADYQELAAAGFNLVLADGPNRDFAHQAGLMTWTGVGTLDLENRAESETKLMERVNAAKNHPSVVFLETVDEPAWTWIGTAEQDPKIDPGDPRRRPEQLTEAYPIIKRLAPDKLLYTNQGPTNLVKTLQAYNSGTDITAVDIYPVNPGGLKYSYALFPDGHQGDLNNTYISQVGEYTDKMRRVTGASRPLFMVLQGFAWEMLTPEPERREEKVLFPTYHETRFMAYQSLIKGANGILYWGTHYTPQPSQFWTYLKRVVREISELSGPLTQRSAALTLAIDYQEIGYSVDDGLQYLCKEQDGKLYVFTCNADKNACEAILSGFGEGWKTCRVLNEARADGDAIPLSGGGFRDRWNRFGVHVYELSR